MGLLSWFTGGRKEAASPINFACTGDYSFDIVGESFYQPALEKICGGRTEDGHRKIVTALLVHENDNPHDNKAICVVIGGKTVGYFSKQDARAYRKALMQLGRAGANATCSAMIVGGWDRGKGDKGHFGVKLDLAQNT